MWKLPMSCIYVWVCSHWQCMTIYERMHYAYVWYVEYRIFPSCPFQMCVMWWIWTESKKTESEWIICCDPDYIYFYYIRLFGVTYISELFKVTTNMLLVVFGFVYCTYIRIPYLFNVYVEFSSHTEKKIICCLFNFCDDNDMCLSRKMKETTNKKDSFECLSGQKLKWAYEKGPLQIHIHWQMSEEKNQKQHTNSQAINNGKIICYTFYVLFYSLWMNELSLSMDMAMAVKMALHKITVATVFNAYACLLVFHSIKAVFSTSFLANVTNEKKIVIELFFWIFFFFHSTINIDKHIYKQMNRSTVNISSFYGKQIKG